MKVQRISAKGRSLEDLREEYELLGYRTEIDGDELVVYYGQESRKKKAKQQQQSDKWSKRERNFGYTRG